MAAIVGTNKLSETGSPGTSNFTTSGSLNPSVSTLYLLTVMNRANSGTPNTPTATHAGGLTWVQVATVRSGTTQLRWTMFRAMKSSGLSSGTITVSMAAQNTTTIDVVVDEFANVDTSGTDGSGAVVQSATGNGNAASSSVTLSAFADATNNVGYGISGNDGGQAITPDATATWNELVESADHFIETEWKTGQDTTVTSSWSTSKNWGAIAVELKMKAVVTATLSQPTETDSATAMTHYKVVRLGQASETDTALSPNQPLRRKSIGQATETDSAQAMAHYKLVRLSQATETDTATAFVIPKRRLAGQATETDAAQAITPHKIHIVSIGQAEATEEAQTICPVGGRNTREIAIALTSDSPASLSLTADSHSSLTLFHE